MTDQPPDQNDKGPPPLSREQLEAEMVEVIKTFDTFLKQLRVLDNALLPSPDVTRRAIKAKLENRLAGKVLERKSPRLSPFELLKNILKSVQDINEMLTGEMALPEIPQPPAPPKDPEPEES